MEGLCLPHFLYNRSNDSQNRVLVHRFILRFLCHLYVHDRSIASLLLKHHLLFLLNNLSTLCANRFKNRQSVRIPWHVNASTLLGFLTVLTTVSTSFFRSLKNANAVTPIQKLSADTKLVRNCTSDTASKEVELMVGVKGMTNATIGGFAANCDLIIGI